MIGDKDQEQRRRMLNHAMMNSGYGFIKLRLLDVRKNRIQGALCLHGDPFEDHSTGMINYHFEISGEPLVFEYDENTGGYYTNMLDVEHNRRFLASMSSFRYWIIEDKKIEKEILELAESMTQKIIQKPIEKQPEEKKMSDDELKRKALEIQAELTKRELEKTKPVEMPKSIEIPQEEPVVVTMENPNDTPPPCVPPINDEFITINEEHENINEIKKRGRKKKKQLEIVGG